MKSPSVLLLLLLGILLALIKPGSAYRHGDVVWSMRRLSVGSTVEGKEKSDWGEMLAEQCPRFSADKKVLFDFDSEYLLKDQVYHMTFSFGNNQFVTHPIKIADLTKSPPVYLNFITFNFVYSGDDIVSLKWKTDYSDDGEDSNAENAKRTITVLYQWEERQRHDVRLALNVVFLAGTLTCACLIGWVLGPGEKGNEYVKYMAKSGPRQAARKQPSTPTTPGTPLPETPESSREALSGQQREEKTD